MTYCSNYSWKSFSVIDENSIRTDSNFSTGDSFTYGGADATMYVYDNDGGMAGDNGANEQGTDSQTGWVQEDGQWTEAGNVYWEGYYVMQGSDGQKYYMIEIEGTKLEDGGNDYFAFYGKVPPQGVELTALCYYGDSGSLSYSCLDGGELGASAIAPDANDDFLAVMQGEGFGDGDINVLLNDDSNTSEALVVKEVDGSASLVAVWLDLPEGGRILVAADGSVDFDAAGDFDALGEGQTATVSIDYVVLNSDGLTDTATLTIEVTGVNDAPVAVDQAVTTDEDTAITGNVMDGAYDIDGDAVSLDGISLGAIGEEIAVTTANGYTGTVVVNADGTFTYTPGPDADDMAQGEADTFTFDFTVKSQNGTTTVGNSRVIDFETGEAVVTYTDGAGNPGNDKPVGSVGEDPNGTGSAENGTTVGNSDGFGVDGTTTSGGGDLLAGDVVTTQIEGMTISVKANGKAGKYDEAMIFDSNNPTGGDSDLATNTQNNVLIISEDGKSGDPDDNSKGGEIRFAFDEPEDVSSLTLIDNEEGVWIGFFDANWCKTGEQWVPGGADNSINTVALNGQNVSYMIVVLEGSGAIDDLVLGSSYEVPAYLYDTATITVNITGDSDGPTAVADTAITDEDTSVSGNVIENDIDAAGYSVVGLSEGTVGEAFEVTSAGGRTGLLTINADGSYTFAPNDGFEDLNDGDTDTLSISYSLGQQGSSVADQLIVNGDFESIPANVVWTQQSNGQWAYVEEVEGWTSPVDVIELQQGTVSGSTANDAGNTIVELDAEANATIAQTITAGSDGTFSLDFDYIPRNYGDGVEASGGMEVLVDGVVVASISAQTAGTYPQSLSLDLTAGEHVIAFRATGVSDKHGARIDNVVMERETGAEPTVEATAELTITVTGVDDNLPPVITTETGYLAEVISEDEIATGNINDSVVDPDGDTLTVSAITDGVVGGGVVGQPNAVTTDGGNTGTITVNTDGSYTYTPDPTSPLDLGDTDTVTVSIEVTDGAETIPVDIFVTINGVNAGPAVVSIALSMDENTQRNTEASAVSGDLLAGSSDADGDAVALQSTTLGTIGSTVDVVTTGNNAGKLTINADGTFTYASNDDSLDLTETDTLVFDYTVMSTGGTTVQTDTKTVTITINGLNEAPVAISQSVSVTEENFAGLTSSVAGNLLAGATDFDGDVISLASTTQGAIGSTVPVTTDGGRSGELTINADGTFTFASTDSSLDLGQSDTLTFDFTVESTAGVLVQTSTATATVNINGSNVAPVTISSAHEVSEANAQGLASTLSGNLLDGSSDADGDIVSIFSTSIGAVGETVTIEVGTGRFAELTIEADGAFTLTSLDDSLDLNASDLFEIEFTAVSSGGATQQFSTSTASFTINGVNVAPVAGDVSVEVFEKNAIGEVSTVTGNLLANSTDADGDTVYLTSTTLGTFGQAVSVMTTGSRSGLLTVEQDGSFTFTSTSSDLDQGALDDFEFGFTVSSTGGTTVQSSTANATININGINVPPVSIDQFYQTDEATTLFDSAGSRVNLLIGASDADGDNVTLTGLSDGLVISTVNNPVANEIFQNNVLIGRLTVFVDGGVRYQPTAEVADLMNAGDVDTVSFQYTVSSNDGGVISTSTKDVVIEILGLDDVIPNTPPVVRGATYIIDETEVVNGDLKSLVTDDDIGDTISIQSVDGQTLGLSNTIELTSETNGWTGSLTVASDGTFTFDPSDQFLAMTDGDSELVTFNYVASDSAGATGEATITINVQGVGDSPAGSAQVNYFFLIDASSSMFGTADIDCDFNGDGVYSWVDLSVGLAGQLGEELPAIWEDAVGVTTSTAYYTYGSNAEQVGSPYDIDAEAGTSSNLAGALDTLAGIMSADSHNEVIIFSDNLSSNTDTQTAANNLINNYNTTISSYLVGAGDGGSSNSPLLNDCTDVTEEYWSAVMALEDIFYEMT